MTSQPAILVLADGNVFHGQAFGKIGTTTGEICFNTGMTGYQEVFTDPSYTGQVIIMNNVHVGNYGVKSTDVESKSVKIHGLIGRNLEEKYSRLMADGNLNEYLINNNIVSIEGLDTRALVAHVRTKGAMNCIISSEILDEAKLKEELATLIINLKNQQNQINEIELLIVRGQKYELAKEFKVLKKQLLELINGFENLA